MRYFTGSSCRGMGLAAGLGALALAVPAVAAPFTWNSSAAVAGADGSLTADSVTVQSYAKSDVAPSGSSTEHGPIDLPAFGNGNDSGDATLQAIGLSAAPALETGFAAVLGGALASLAVAVLRWSLLKPCPVPASARGRRRRGATF